MTGPDTGWNPHQGWGPAPVGGHQPPADPNAGWGTPTQPHAPGYGYQGPPLQGEQWGPFTPTRPRRSRRKLVIGAVAAVVLVAGGVIGYVAWPAGSFGKPSGPAEAAVPTTALSASTVRVVPASVLPTEQQLQQATLLDLKKNGDVDTNVYPDTKVDPPSCTIAASPDNASTAGQSVSMAAQLYTDKPGDDYRLSAYVSAVVFDTDDGAASALTKVTDAAKGCASYTYTGNAKPGQPARPWSISDIKTQGTQVTWLNSQAMDATHSTPWKCGRAVRAQANMVVTSAVCSQNPSSGPSKLVDTVITNVNNAKK
ncbi:sensor domain-containing protein [Mycolicibacterium sphagni]|uniref:Sensor domain-containing protein n=1 Tax=Mycolicibacterium sphagni TaxID=1786 RepID=A0ABX2K170_9MYCO|nr:sensor domain-containing protein [Mycolicibacterium sphagni]NTY62598.1 sensor domain-containing protein [Mycolicibacterium sphagni]